MEKPNYLASTGHVGNFTEPDPNSHYFEGELFSSRSAPHPGVIKFQGLFIPPFIQFLRTSPNTFIAFGAWFSLLYEAARKLNYSLVGRAPPVNIPENEIWGDIFSFRPDVVFIPVMPNNNAELEAIDMGLASFSKFAWMLQMDHILSRKSYHHPNLMAMMTPFDGNSLVLMVIGLMATSLLARYFKDGKEEGSRLNNIIWNLVTALISSPEVATKKAFWRMVGLSWTVGVFWLQQLFSGDMFTAMTLPPDLDVVDTYEELATRTTAPIVVFDSAEADGSGYLSPYREHREELTKRLRVVAYECIYNSTIIDRILANVSEGHQFHLGMRHILKQYVNDYFGGRYKDNVYISSEFGQPIPSFIGFNGFIDDVIRNAFNEILVRMRESHIYEKWVDAYRMVVPDDPNLIVEFDQAENHHFVGLYVICGAMFLIAAAVLVVELVVQRSKGSEFEMLDSTFIRPQSGPSMAVVPIEASCSTKPVAIAAELDVKVEHQSQVMLEFSDKSQSFAEKNVSKRPNGCVVRSDTLEQINTILLDS